MTFAKLPPYLVALIHRVELSNSDWWENATSRMIVAVLLSTKSSQSVASITRQLARDLHLRLTPSEVGELLATLAHNGDVVQVGNDAWAVSAATRKRNDDDTAELRNLELRVEQYYSLTLADLGLERDAPSWIAFRDNCLIPLVAREGADILSFSAPATRPTSDLLEDSVLAFLDSTACDRDAMERAIQVFLSGANNDVKLFVLHNLEAYFVLVATGLDAGTLDSIAKMQASRVEASLLLDTNFLFSVFGWHDHPLNEAALAIMESSQLAKERIEVALYVANITLNETRTAIRGKSDSLANIRLSSNIATAAADLGISGFLSEYLERRREKAYAGSIEEYTSLVDYDLGGRARRLGMECIDIPEDEYSMRQDVVDAINNQLEYEKRFSPGDRRSYDRYRHDAILYFYARDRQQESSEHLLDGGVVIVTLDSRLLGFDRYYAKISGRRPICMHPVTLLQVLRFFVPRSESYEEGLFSVIRLPFLSGKEMAEAEALSLRILSRVSSLGGIEDISEEAIVKVLMDEGVRGGFQRARTLEEELAVVETAFVGLAAEKELVASEAEDRARQLEVKLQERDAQLGDAKRRLGNAEEAVESRDGQLGAVVAEAAGYRGQVAELESEKLQNLDRARAAEARADLLSWALKDLVGLGALAILVAVGIGTVLHQWLSARLVTAYAAGLVVVLVPWIWLAYNGASRRTGLRQTKEYLWLARRGRWLAWVLGMISLGVLANLVWELLKSRLPL